VDATRVDNDAGRAAVAVNGGGDCKQLLAARAVTRRTRGRPSGGAKAMGELGGDAWSGAGTVVGLGRRGNGSGRRCCRTAEEAEEGGAGQGLICSFQKFQGPHCKPKFPTNLKFK
jgi:hypothetical protein